MKMRITIISLSICLATLVFLPPDAFAQGSALSIGDEIAILKAEDARRYDKILENLLKDPHYDVRTRAALAAGRIGDEAAIPALLPLL